MIGGDSNPLPDIVEVVHTPQEHCISLTLVISSFLDTSSVVSLSGVGKSTSDLLYSTHIGEL